ncbi:hypothetical protein H072_8070 [Dactylellina haptotyla CBS 200.50]|uniref:Uncharacterized protein n=1 Tax=Dactylellina haptotyla (strain CBS 200.50) TaxID=1284197 RepID=S8A5M3_DACHA|nr:hypothetical protein H072_8070 [Dactylellina haptotyla CBS 200.50]
MPRPPRRTAATRRGEQKAAVHVDSPAPAVVIPSSPPVTRRTRAAKAASTLSTASDIDTVPSTHPPSNTNDGVPESSGTVSHNTIKRANQAASVLPKTVPANVEVSKTPSPTAVLRVADVVSMSTPGNFGTRGKKRDSKTAFEEDFAASLLAAEESEDENEGVLPETPTKSSGGPQKKRLSLEKFPGSARPLLNLTSRTAEKGKRTLNPDETIDFNYSSSPERSPAQKRFGFLQPLEDSDSESEEEEDHDFENQNFQQDEEQQEEPAQSRPRRKRATSEKPKEADPKHPTTKTLQSLLPKRRTKTKSKPSKSKITKETSKEKGKAPTKARSALVDVTKDILDEDELQAIDAPSRPLFGAGMDILSDDELGREIYVDSSARSSSVGAPPSPESPPRRAARGGKGKGRAASADPETGRRPSRRTYGKPRRQDSEVSNKENDTPARVRGGGNLLSASGKLADAANNMALNKKEKREVDDIRKKFREVDDWDLCFEDVVPSSSDGIVHGGR